MGLSKPNKDGLSFASLLFSPARRHRFCIFCAKGGSCFKCLQENLLPHTLSASTQLHACFYQSPATAHPLRRLHFVVVSTLLLLSEQRELYRYTETTSVYVVLSKLRIIMHYYDTTKHDSIQPYMAICISSITQSAEQKETNIVLVVAENM